MYKLIIRVRRPSQENQAPDLTLLGRTCEAASLLDEARGWYFLAIARDPLDSEAAARSSDCASLAHYAKHLTRTLAR